MSKVIVNGGSGFIGLHLADKLVRRGYHVIILDGLSINELAEIVLKFTGKCIEPAHQEARSGDIMDSLANISKAKAFNYYPKYTL